MAMAEEEHTQKYTNSSRSSSSSSSKKMKPKKIPQRGLGVAQLEKIRIEEEHRKDAALLSVLQAPFRAHQLSPVGPVDLNGQPQDDFGQYSWAKLGNGDRHHHGSRFMEPSFIESQRSQQCHHSSSSSSLMNVSGGISSSSEVNFQTEPPSSQNYCGNNYTPLWQEEVKMVGIKRHCPFSSEYPPLTCKFPPTREGPSISLSESESDRLRLRREKENFAGDFLTLAPPTSSSSRLDQRYHRSSHNLAPLLLEEKSCQRGGEEELVQHSVGSRSDHQPLIHGFFPSANMETGQEGSPQCRCKGKVNGGVDLNLKL